MITIFPHTPTLSLSHHKNINTYEQKLNPFYEQKCPHATVQKVLTKTKIVFDSVGATLLNNFALFRPHWFTGLFFAFPLKLQCDDSKSKLIPSRRWKEQMQLELNSNTHWKPLPGGGLAVSFTVIVGAGCCCISPNTSSKSKWHAKRKQNMRSEIQSGEITRVKLPQTLPNPSPLCISYQNGFMHRSYTPLSGR